MAVSSPVNVSSTVHSIEDQIKVDLLAYLKSDGLGGTKIVKAFMEEFKNLAERSPKDDPTNVLYHLDFLEEHIRKTLDASLAVSEDGNIKLGIGTDDILGFNIRRSKLKHRPVPTAWIVFLIRGIAGEYAFVNDLTYRQKFGQSMPSQYVGGFMISKRAWERECWTQAVGPFRQFRHPASGAPPVPFMRNVVARIDMSGIMKEFFSSHSYEINS